jgi:hypothetical protein
MKVDNWGIMFAPVCRTRTKVGTTHICYSVCESLRVSRDRVVQRSDSGLLTLAIKLEF